MTKQGGFKRAVRQRARATGQRYTEARAVLEQAGKSPFADTRPFEDAALTAHLQMQYGIGVTSIVPIDDDPEFRPRGSWPGHYPWTLIVKREDALRGSPVSSLHRRTASAASRTMQTFCGSSPHTTFPPNGSPMTILCLCSTVPV